MVAGQGVQVVDKDAIQVLDVSDSEGEGEMFAGAVQDAPVVLKDVHAASEPDESKPAVSATSTGVTTAPSGRGIAKLQQMNNNHAFHLLAAHCRTYSRTRLDTFKSIIFVCHSYLHCSEQRVPG